MTTPNKIEENTFAEACYEQNTIKQLQDSLKAGYHDIDMEEWGLTEEECIEQIQIAIENLIHDEEE